MSRSQRPPWLGEDARGWDHARIHRAVLADDRLGAYEIAVYIGLAVHAELATGDARPSIATLAGYARMSVRRAADAIKTLVETRWITVTETPGSASTYRLMPPPTPARGADLGAATPAPDAGVPLHVVPTTPAPRADEQEPVNENQGTRENTGQMFDAGASSQIPSPAEFDQWWQTYPRRVAPAKARAAFAKARKIATFDAIMAGTTRYRDETRGRDQTYIAHPATWLNGERWNDEPGANRSAAKTGAAAPIERRNQPSGRIDPWAGVK